MSNKNRMKNSENKEKYILLDNLFNLFLDMKYQKEDEDLLKQEEIDVDKIVQKNMLLFRQLRTQAKAELNQEKHNRVLEFMFENKDLDFAADDIIKQLDKNNNGLSCTGKDLFREINPK